MCRCTESVPHAGEREITGSSEQMGEKARKHKVNDLTKLKSFNNKAPFY